jgi:hypothetical protein
MTPENMTTDLVIRENQVQVLTTQDLTARIKEETEQRKLVTEYISQHMKANVDFGTIKIKTRDGREIESKASLFKPGSEKFCSLFHFRPTFERDDDSWEMSGKIPGLFCYRCELISTSGAVVGEGRGTAKLSEKQGWTENNAIKIAEKRAQIDAVLRTGGLSDFFTQDIEDMPKEAFGNENVYVPTHEARPTIKTPLTGAITEPQTRAIFGTLKAIGMTEEEFKTKFEVEHISSLTKQQASDLITRLNTMRK